MWKENILDLSRQKKKSSRANLWKIINLLKISQRGIKSQKRDRNLGALTYKASYIIAGGKETPTGYVGNISPVHSRGGLRKFSGSETLLSTLQDQASDEQA